MKFLQRLLNFYINSSIHVALSVYALVRITEMYFGLPYNEPIDYFIFYGTITGYNFVKYASITKLHHQSLMNNVRSIHLLTLICFMLIIYYGFQLSWSTIVYFVPFAFLTLIYAVPVCYKSTNVRNIPTLKIIIIALVWAGVTVLIPVIDAGLPITLKVIVMSIQRFLFIIVLTLPFDIRDFLFDKKELQTIPQILGVERTKKFGFVMLALTIALEFFITPNSNFKTVFLIIFMLLLVLLQRASIRQEKYYASFWVEAIPIFWWILLLVI